jgi:lysophospholipase L1-like esterase
VTWKRRIAFALAAAMMAVALASALLLAADIWAHRRAERTAGVNRLGYRGPVVDTRRADAWRAVMLGGSTVFGYGLLAGESLPAQLEQVLREKGTASSVVNLGFNSEGAYAFAATLRDYASLRPELVILYEGYNDLLPESPNRLQARHQSIIFRWTGYFPILPMVLRDKADGLGGGDSGPKVVFGAAAGALEALSREIGRLTPGESSAPIVDATAAVEKWRFYCDGVTSAVRVARQAGADAMVVTQPYISDRHIEQQRALRAALTQFASDPHVAYFDGGRVIDLHDGQLAFDGMHLTPQGNRRMAEALAPVVLRLAEARVR